MRFGGGERERGGESRFKPSFYRPYFHSAFRAFAQSFLFFVAPSFPSTIQRTANAHLYQGVSPSLPVLHFEWAACFHAPVCPRSGRLVCMRTPVCHVRSRRTGSTTSVLEFQIAIAQRVFDVCAYGHYTRYLHLKTVRSIFDAPKHRDAR